MTDCSLSIYFSGEGEDQREARLGGRAPFSSNPSSPGAIASRIIMGTVIVSVATRDREAFFGFGCVRACVEIDPALTLVLTAPSGEGSLLLQDKSDQTALLGKVYNAVGLFRDVQMRFSCSAQEAGAALAYVGALCAGQTAYIVNKSNCITFVKNVAFRAGLDLEQGIGWTDNTDPFSLARRIGETAARHLTRFGDDGVWTGTLEGRAVEARFLRAGWEAGLVKARKPDAHVCALFVKARREPRMRYGAVQALLR